MLKLILLLSMFSEDKLKCPECEKDSCESFVNVQYSGSTLLGWTPYYDKEGEYHAHDPNNHTTFYTCSEGHEFSRSRKAPCPNKDCKYGK